MQVETQELNQIDRIIIDFPSNNMIIDVEYTKVTVLLGANGTGKSFVLKTLYYLGYCMSSYTSSLLNLNIEPDVDFYQFALDNVYDNPDFTGFCKLIYKCRSSIEIQLERGKVIDKIIKIPFHFTKSAASINYMSSGMRLFSNILTYLRFRKMKSVAPDHLFSESILEHVLKNGGYKLYDVLAVEKLLNVINKGVYNNTNKFLEGFIDNFIPIKKIHIDYNLPEINILYDNGIIKNITTLSNGEQALYNTFLMQE